MTNKETTPLNYIHKDDVELFIRDNIEIFNKQQKSFDNKILEKAGCNFKKSEIREYLKTKLFNECEENKAKLLKRLEEYEYKIKNIELIANEFIYCQNDLRKTYENWFMEDLEKEGYKEIAKIVYKSILDSSNLDKGKIKIISNNLLKTTEKSVFLLLKNGFSTNRTNINSGIITANAGDSAQFLFISRAILAGYNCSNVDVRSSRYDAVIDYEGDIFKVQVKGISGEKISFKDRDRGGIGIDSTNEHNIGKIITKDDCDIYVAVDKQVGICYIIPMIEIDKNYSDEQKKSVKLRELEKYKENWTVIDNLKSILKH